MAELETKPVTSCSQVLYTTLQAGWVFNSLPNDKIVDLSKLKAIADDKLDVTQKLRFALERVENIVGKGENAGYNVFKRQGR